MLLNPSTWRAAFRFRHVLLEAVVSLSLAFLVWLYTHSRARESTDYLQIPVQVQLGPGQRDLFAVETGGQGRISISFTGPTSRVRELRRRIQRGAFQVTKTVTVPEDKQNENMYCDVLRIDEDDVPAPVGIKAEIADEGHTIPVTIHRLTERMLPVRLDVTGEVRVAQVKVEPPTVLVRGPKVVLDRVSFIPTQPCSLHADVEPGTGADAVVRDQIALVTELEGRPIRTNPRNVAYRCKVYPKQKLYELRDVPVHFLCPENFAFRPRFLNERPSKIALTVLGPASEVPPPVLAFVDLTSGNFARGRNLEPVRLQLPKDFQLVQTTAPVVAFYLDEAERSTALNQQTPEP